MRDVFSLFYMGRPQMTDFLGGVHATQVRFLGVWMSVPDALRHLPEAVRIMQVTKS